MVPITHEQNIICTKTRLNVNTHEQTIICRQLFAGHVVGSRPIERKEKMYRMITSIRIPSSEPFVMFINIRVLRLSNTDWKSSLRTFAPIATAHL